MTTAVKIRGLTIDGSPVRCPGSGSSGRPPIELTLLANGSTVMATCGERHRPRRGEVQAGPRAQCFFPLPALSPGVVAAVGRAKPGQIRVALPDGKQLQGKLLSTGTAAAGGVQASAAFAAAQAKTGTTTGPARVPSGGGAAVAAFGALAAVANMGAAAANAVGTTAAAASSAVGSVASLGTEGLRTARAGIDAADHAGERRHARKMRAANSGGDQTTS